MTPCALVALGSNLGDRRNTLLRAVEALEQTPGVTVRQVSAFHETRPVGGPPGQGLYFNAAARLETTLEPLPLLRRLQEIEDRNGRIRHDRWGERTLDLDLLLYDDLIMTSEELTIPHPRMADRRFVLEPLAEVAPDVLHPVSGHTVAQLLRNLGRENPDGQERPQ